MNVSSPAHASPAAARPEGAYPLPTFLVAGVEKAGTTALYHFLDAHPEVHMSPVKEPGFFAPGYGGPEVRHTWEAYRALFADAGDAKAVGEATPYYLQDPHALDRIAGALPGVRVVVILRHPVERALSHYLMLTNNHEAVKPEAFGRFFERHMADPAGLDATKPGVRALVTSFYADALERWIGRLGADRVRVFFNEDLKARPAELLREVYAFIGVDPAFEPAGERRYNVGHGLPRSGAFQRFLFRPSALKRLARRVLPDDLRLALRRRAFRLNRGARPTLTPAERAAFAAYFRDDVRRVERLTGRDLSHWLA